ncbi:sigma-54-dependent Fis family transcriptional regulator [Kaustia mangrovi]|uniref:DNA-binding transcriptional regulator NtrC n=1 Tax=Kaustia mangrovi TaxID=2593653 RepID=A0A7S8C2I8_9HYPH|nr:sigma-54 dependent transcriptional regulator [Kaustia mangrovi]QPC42170.1 sigma-54-dependent Fis family transcriptional regulator [Kaustia mangrovi]
MAQVILIVDDDPAQRRILESMIRRFGYETLAGDSGQSAIDILAGPQGKDVALLILDLEMPDIDGMEVLAYLSAHRKELPVIIQTVHGSIETVVKAMRAGADDFVAKPVNPERVKVSIQNLMRVNALSEEVKRLNHKASGEFSFEDLIAESPAMTNVVRLGRRAAQSNIPILIEGESGVGKEMIARAIQGESERRGKPFVTVNCGAIPENLVESILFGHEKGSFTGATARHTGKFVEANGGTLFLDEVGELPAEAQVKLLRALQDGEVDPIGARRPVKVNIRLISATNRDMIEMVKAGTFREDLYYRLNVFPITVPPLRERTEGIPALVNHFVTRFAAEEGRKIKGIEANALELLRHYSWPGNVRQLENTVFRAIVLCEGDVLTVDDFPQIAAQVDGFEARVPPAPSAATSASGRDGITVFASGAPAGDSPLVGNGQPLGIPAVTEGGHIRTLEEVEADMIRLALERYHGHMSEVARKLGIGRSTLYRKVRDLGLEAKM